MQITLSLLFSYIILSFAFTSCNSDEIDLPDYVKEGEPAKVSIRINLDEMSAISRADLNADLENRVKSLWLGIYNASSKQRKFSKFYTSDDDFPEVENLFGKISDIETTSGNCYIVAVANYDNAAAIDLMDNSNKGKDTEYDLYELLSGADTWDKYRAIAIKQDPVGGNAHIEVPAEELVMQGSYRSAGHKNDYTEDETVETVAIRPGSNTLNGVIHLRRIWTQNKFIIKPSDDIISMELVDFTVMNVPMLTWLHGRPQNRESGVLDYANAGDSYSQVMPDDLNHPMYLKSLKYTPTSMTVTTDSKGRPNYTFDYWQYENKRTGTARSYAEREKEYKNADGSNSGIYSSLCGGNKATLDNNATYIRFTAKIKYIDDKITSPDEIADEVGNVRYRNAEATYYVHLGYIGDDASDFNCFRNSKYTYSISVKSVDQILLEAYREGENQPGAEGLVTDVTDEFFELDAHFCTFNIYFTKEEMKGFTFSMTSYEDGIPHTITNITDESLGVTANVPTKGGGNWKYYNWIQLIENGKTDEETKIAKFPKLDANGYSDKVLYLDDIKKKADELADGEGYCFTVYVKEYAYEADYGESGYGNEHGTEWTHYVNQPSRTANFNVAYKVSADKESQHFKAKYALSQRSIQTYYDISKAGSDGIDATAFGAEHINEVFGMNIRWTIGTISMDPDNGRWNIGQAINLLSNKSWSEVLDTGNLLTVNRINNTEQTKYATHMNFDGGTKYVTAIKQITSGLSGNEGYWQSKASTYDPQTNDATAQYIQAIYSCMNRNKDENGDGVIDNCEVKWYVPASGKYLRLIIGRNNLTTPLMNYEQKILPQGCADDFNTIYHFISSDQKIVWADEGMSSSMFNVNKAWSHAPWQVRCIRNLGTDLSDIAVKAKVKRAYDDTDVDKSTTKGGIIKPTRYYATALRNPTVIPLPPHKTSAPENRIALYGFEIAPAGNNNTTNYDREAGLYAITYNNAGTPQSVNSIGANYTEIKNAIESASPCEKLNKTSGRSGWRIPNQKEIVIMLRAGVINQSGYYIYSLNWNNNLSSYSSGWGGSGGMMCCTQEHWPSMTGANFGTTNTNPVNSSDELSGRNRWCTIEPGSSLASAKIHSNIQGVRCVRDLTAKEANMTYEQIKKYKTD